MAFPDPSEPDHDDQRAHSYDILEKARQNARKKSGYDSQATRVRLSSLFSDRFGQNPYDWQLDVTEAIILGLDSVVIAGTGSGKTIPFMLALLHDSKKKAIIVSPLKVLQEDQVSRFVKLNITAAAVNRDTWCEELQQELRNDRYQGIFASPEMCLKHQGFRSLLSESKFQNIAAVIIDEAHCIGQWGGDFRKAYSELGKLRSFFPPHVPFFATSATLEPRALREVRTSLGIDAHDSFFLNLGNDRPNISYHVHQMKSSKDFEAIKPHLSTSPLSAIRGPEDLTRTIIFTNSVAIAQLGHRKIRSWLPRHLRKHVGYLYAYRSPRAKRRVMRKFRNGKYRVLIATEAAGMGADIPDVEQVIQFGVPSSLSVWLQRAGRAGRSFHITARAILLAEESMFQRIRKRRRKGDEEDKVGQSGPPSARAARVEDDKMDDTKYEWKKKVEEALRQWISTKECRRDVADRHFANPPHRQPPTAICCDNCHHRESMMIDFDDELSTQRPVTPENDISDVSSAPSTPSKRPDSNGKRKQSSKEGPKTRRGQVLTDAKAALRTWSIKMVRTEYPFLTPSGFLPDAVLTALASNATIKTVSDLQSAVSWAFSERYGANVIAVLSEVDARALQLREEAKRARAAERRAETVARREEKKRRTEEDLVEKENQVRQTQTGKPRKFVKSTPLQGMMSVMNFRTPLAPWAAQSAVQTPSLGGMFVDYLTPDMSIATTSNATPGNNDMLTPLHPQKHVEPLIHVSSPPEPDPLPLNIRL